MATRPKVTRATTTKAKTTNPPPAASRATRTVARSTPTPPLGEPLKKGTSRKPFANRDNSPEGKKLGLNGSQSKASVLKSSSYVSVSDDADREPIRVSSDILP